MKTKYYFFFLVIALFAQGCQEQPTLVATEVPVPTMTRPSATTPGATPEATPTLHKSNATPPTPEFSLTGKIIYNVRCITPDDWSECEVYIPLLEKLIDGAPSGTSYILDRANFFFSNNGQQLAFPCIEKTFGHFNVCILKTAYLKMPDKNNLSYYLKRIFIKEGGTTSIDRQIRNISWSPDDRYLVVTFRWAESLWTTDATESPCLVDVRENKADCGSSNRFLASFSEVDQQIIKGVYAFSWSPVEKEKLVFPLQKNWSPFYDSDQLFPSFMPTGDYKDGLYMMDLQTKTLTPVWLAPSATRMDYEQLPLWSAKGEKITFVLQEGGEKSADGASYYGGGGLLVLQNYVVVMINKDGSDYKRLFDGKDVYDQIGGLLPLDFQGGIKIRVGAWSPDERYLLFEVDMSKYGVATSFNSGLDNQDYIMGLFLYDTETGFIYQIRQFEFYGYDYYPLMPDWGP
jgi:hypothetical protein